MRKHIVTFILLLLATLSYAQTENSAADVIDYREVDGKIIVKAMVNGVMADFVVDLSGHITIMESELERLKINGSEKTNYGYTKFICRDYTPKYAVAVEALSVGNIVASLGINCFVITDEPYLKELGVVGTIDASLFSKYILTIDTNRKKITVTAPYRPPYIGLGNRTNSSFSKGSTVSFDIMIDNVACNVTLDTWNNGAVSLSTNDYERLSIEKKNASGAKISLSFEKNSMALRSFKASEVTFVKSTMKDVQIAENCSLKKSVIGLDFLKNGIISIDFSKDKIYFQPHGTVTIDDSLILPKEVVIEAGKMNPITAKYFRETIFDYTKTNEFISKSDKIYVIDFWATWCGPCMQMMPQMEAMATRYKDKVIFCKVNADKEKELCNAFGVKALPTLFLFRREANQRSKSEQLPKNLKQLFSKC